MHSPHQGSVLQGHCGPLEAANDEYTSVLDAAAYEKERSIEKENEHFDRLEIQKHDVDFSTIEPSDARNDLQIKETEETSDVDLDDLQMDETEDPFAEELDDLVLNTITRKCNTSSVAQLNREKYAANKDSR